MMNRDLKAGDQAYLLRPWISDSDCISLGIVEQSEKGQLSINGVDITPKGKRYISDGIPTAFLATEANFELLIKLFGKRKVPEPKHITDPNPSDITRLILKSGLTKTLNVKASDFSFYDARDRPSFNVASLSKYEKDQVVIIGIEYKYMVPYSHDGVEITRDNVDSYLNGLRALSAEFDAPRLEHE